MSLLPKVLIALALFGIQVLTAVSLISTHKELRESRGTIKELKQSVAKAEERFGALQVDIQASIVRMNQINEGIHNALEKHREWAVLPVPVDVSAGLCHFGNCGDQTGEVRAPADKP